MSIAFLEPGYLALLALLPPLLLLSLRAGKYRGGRRWLVLALRTLLLLALILSLAGMQLGLPVDRLTTVFLLDSSDSVSPGERARAEAFIEQALGAMGKDDQAALVIFGQNALVEQPPASGWRLGRIRAVPVAARTNIAGALELALALLPSDSQRRIVLLSDGGENEGRSLELLRVLTARGIPVEVVPLGAEGGGAEAALANLSSVSRARRGQEIELVARVESNVAQQARLIFLADNVVLLERDVALIDGVSTFTQTTVVEQQGYRRYSAEIRPVQDTRPQNNEAGTLVEVDGPPRVLIVEGSPDEADNLVSALSAARVTPVVVSPAEVPSDLPGLGEYELVVLANVPARELPRNTQELLQLYVRDLGRGLVMLGGERSFGIGGYSGSPLEEALPVWMDVRTRERRPDVTVVFVVDRSGSMAESGGRGRDKLDVAKEAISQAVEILSEQDQVGIIAFDDQAYTMLEPTRLEDRTPVEKAISSIDIGGGTDILSGLRAAEAMIGRVDTSIRHVILLTDGISGEEQAQLQLASRLNEQGVTLSVLAAGADTAAYLGQLALNGGGRYYAARSINDVPQFLLDELVHTIGTYIIEEPFTPAYAGDSPILAELQAGLPKLYGYNGTTEKDEARVILVGPEGGPVLAQWQYGLGRSVAWTSDMKGKWALDWVRWAEFPRFASQLIAWVLPALRAETVSVQASAVGGELEINLSAEDQQGEPLSDLTVSARIAGSAALSELTLREVAPGRYVARIASPQAGTYLIHASGVDAQGKPIFTQTGSVVVPYSPEYRQGQGNPQLLGELASRSQGRVLERPGQAFEHTLSARGRALPLSIPLLLLAALLLPLDIAARRLTLSRRARAAWRAPAPAPVEAPPRPVEADPAAIAGGADPKPAAPATPVASTNATPAARTPARAVTPPAPASEPAGELDPAAISDPLERLRAARERKRRK